MPLSAKQTNEMETKRNHLNALEESLLRELGRLGQATNARERKFREVQVFQKRKEIDCERKFIGMAPEVEKSDAEILFELGVF